MWDSNLAVAFKDLVDHSAGSRLLLTTRFTNLIPGSQEIVVDKLTGEEVGFCHTRIRLKKTHSNHVMDSYDIKLPQIKSLISTQALQMLAQGSEPNAESHGCMMRVLKLCHNHALAVSMAAALQRESRYSWAETERILQNHKPHVQWVGKNQVQHGRKYRGLLECIDLSVRHLSPVDRERYLKLAVLPEDAWVPAGLLQHYWGCQDKEETHQLIERLCRRYLVEVNRNAKDHSQSVNVSIKPHDLQLDYLRAAAVLRQSSKASCNKHETLRKTPHSIANVRLFLTGGQVIVDMLVLIRMENNN